MIRNLVPLLAYLAMGASLGPAAAAASFAEECERLAADPKEPNRQGAGVPIENIDSNAAVLACLQAAHGPLTGKPGSRYKKPPEPETTYRLIRAYLAEGPAQDMWAASSNARKIKGIAENANNRGRLSPETEEWYVEKGRQYFRPETYLADANAGKASAQMALAYLYLDPYMQLDDPKAGEAWFAKALAQEYPAAMLKEGLHRLKTAHTPEASRDAVNLIVKAAMRENHEAQWQTALLYLKGKHVPENRKTATGWATLAAGRGNGEARRWLRDQEIAPGTVVIGSILAAMIGAAIIDGLADEADAPGNLSDAELRAQQNDSASRQGNCLVGYRFNPYSGYCENSLGERQ